MLNAIRITTGTLMAMLAIGGLWFVLLFTGFKVWEYFTSLSTLLDFIVIVIAPSLSAYLLLRPKSQKDAFIGLGIFVVYLVFIYVDQIL